MEKTVYPRLYARSTTGKIKFWQVKALKKPYGAALITLHGYEGGTEKKAKKRIYEGKNLGKSNSTTPYEQACLEAESAIRLKCDKGYGLRSDIDKSPTIIRPMLAKKFSEHKQHIKWPCYVQPKLDGMRCIAHKKANGEIVYTSRRGKAIETLEHITEALDPIMRPGDIFDGELYRHGMSLQSIISAVKRGSSVHPNRHKIEYWVFDLIQEDDYFEDRNAILIQRFRNDSEKSPIERVHTALAHNLEDVHNSHEWFTLRGFEGIMLRNRRSRYEINRRSVHLQKYKEYHDSEFEIIGGQSGTGIEEGCIIFRCRSAAGVEFSTRPRGTHEQRREWLDNIKMIIGKKLTVRYLYLTEDGVPFHPVGIAIRDYE